MNEAEHQEKSSRQNDIEAFILSWLDDDDNYKGQKADDCVEDCLEQLNGYYSVVDAEYEYAKNFYLKYWQF
jgi:hypothetical protein